MLVFYVDEVGVGHLGNAAVAEHPWFILGAVGIRDVNRQSLAQAIRDIKGEAFGDSWRTGNWGDTEIKGRYLAHATQRLDRGMLALKPAGYRGLTSTQLKELVDALFRIFRTFSPLLYAIGVDKRRHLATRRAGTPYDPVAIAYAFLQQRLAALVEPTSNAEEGALILADEQSHHETLFRKGQVQAVRRGFRARMFKPPDIAAIIAKPVWIDPDEMVIDREVSQLVDFMLYAVMRGMRDGDWNHPWLERLGPHFARHWGSGRKIGAVWNAGITIYPLPYYRKVRWAQI
jgi:hypothetical protein